MTDKKKWFTITMAGLSFINFCECNLDNKELALLLDGWLVWSMRGYEGITEDDCAEAINRYTTLKIKEGGLALQSWTSVIAVFKESRGL